MIQYILRNKTTTYERTIYLQQTLFSIIPVAVVLLLGAYGSQQVPSDHMLPFTISFLLVASLTFFGMLQVLKLMLQTMDKRSHELTKICRDFLTGKKVSNADVLGNDALSNLAQAINDLIEQNRQQQKHIKAIPPPVKPQPQNAQEEILKPHLVQIIHDLRPISYGDLRVRATVHSAGSLIGTIADTFNSLIDELSQFVRWTRYASQIIVSTSQNILSSSLETAENTETQMYHLSKTINSIEEIAAFIQHLNNTLNLSFDLLKELQQSMTDKMHQDNIKDVTTIQLIHEMQRQTDLFSDVLESAEEISNLAESLINDLHSVAQQIYQSSLSTLKTGERLNELEVLADSWNEATKALKIDEDESDVGGKEPWLL